MSKGTQLLLLALICFFGGSKSQAATTSVAATYTCASQSASTNNAYRVPSTSRDGKNSKPQSRSAGCKPVSASAIIIVMLGCLILTATRRRPEAFKPATEEEPHPT